MKDLEFSKRLKLALEDKGLTQVEVARILSINKDSMSNYSKGRLPKAEILRDIASLCDVSCDWLLTGQGEGPGNRETSRFDINFGARLKELLTYKNISHDQVSESLNVSMEKATKYIEGEIPTSLKLYELSKFLGVTMEWLLTGEKDDFLGDNREVERLGKDYIKGAIITLETISERFTSSMKESVLEIKKNLSSD